MAFHHDSYETKFGISHPGFIRRIRIQEWRHAGAGADHMPVAYWADWLKECGIPTSFARTPDVACGADLPHAQPGVPPRPDCMIGRLYECGTFVQRSAYDRHFESLLYPPFGWDAV